VPTEGALFAFARYKGVICDRANRRRIFRQNGSFMAEDKNSIAREVHALLLSAHPQPLNVNLVKVVLSRFRGRESLKRDALRSRHDHLRGGS
jgi:hypothetical protein